MGEGTVLKSSQIQLRSSDLCCGRQETFNVRKVRLRKRGEFVSV